MSAATALTDPGRAGLPLVPAGLPVRRGRLSLGKLRHAFWPGALEVVEVTAGFATDCHLGRPGHTPPDLGRLVARDVTPIDDRSRITLDRRIRAFLAIADPAEFTVVAANHPAGGLLLIPTDDFDRRLEALTP